MKVTVRFVDGESLQGDAAEVTLDRGGFNLVGTHGNSHSMWVGGGAIKYVVVHPAAAETYGTVDPREASQLQKVVVRFRDGEILRTYRDESFQEQPGGFSLRLWDPERRQLVKALVAGASLKGVFMVDEWDSRAGGDRRPRTPPPPALEDSALDEVTPTDVAGETWAEAEDGVVLAEPEPASSLEAEPPVALDMPAPDEPQTFPEPALEPDDGPALPVPTEETLPAGDVSLEGAAGFSPAEAGEDYEAAPVAPPGMPNAGPTGGASEERRAGFESGLMRRRERAGELNAAEERRRLLRLRVSEILGTQTTEDAGVDDSGTPG